MAEQTYTFRIQRNRVTEGGRMESRWQEYQVKADANATVLSALEDIKGHQDGSLTFRQSCRSAICGSCAMRIGGRTRLACKTHVGIAARDGVVTLAPQANQPVLKDLAIDIGPFFKRIHAIRPFLEEGPETESKVGKTAYDHVNQVSQCIMCGCCYSDCTMAEVSPEYIGPAALAKAFRFVSDPREGKKTDRLRQLSESHMMWACSRCTMCVDVCPKDVKPMEAIVKLRTRGIAKGYIDGAAQKHALAFHEDIKKAGDLNEFTLMMRTLGLAGTLQEVGSALHLMKKGKIPSPFPHQAKGVEQLNKVFNLLEQNPLDVETKAPEIVPE